MSGIIYILNSSAALSDNIVFLGAIMKKRYVDMNNDWEYDRITEYCKYWDLTHFDVCAYWVSIDYRIEYDIKICKCATEYSTISIVLSPSKWSIKRVDPFAHLKWKLILKSCSFDVWENLIDDISQLASIAFEFHTNKPQPVIHRPWTWTCDCSHTYITCFCTSLKNSRSDYRH